MCYVHFYVYVFICFMFFVYIYFFVFVFVFLFVVAFLLSPHLLDMDEYYLSTAEFFIRDKYFISLKVGEDWVDIWFAGEFCFFYKPRQDKLYKNADAIIAFGSFNNFFMSSSCCYTSGYSCHNLFLFIVR